MLAFATLSYPQAFLCMLRCREPVCLCAEIGFHVQTIVRYVRCHILEGTGGSPDPT